jgi:hypothetical protein
LKQELQDTLTLVTCADQNRLLDEYNKAVQDDATVGSRLVNVAGTASGEDFKLLLDEKQRACERAWRARHAYEQHILRHRCFHANLNGRVSKL